MGGEELPATGSRTPHLVVVRDGEASLVVPLRKRRTVIGRASDCELPLASARVSGHHAEVVRQGEAWLVRDLGSTNGTYVNGSRVAEAMLSLGDRITLGGIMLVFTDQPEDVRTLRVVAWSEGQTGAGAPAAAEDTDRTIGPVPGLRSDGYVVEVPLAEIDRRFFLDLQDRGAYRDIAQRLQGLWRLSTELNAVLEVRELLERTADLIIESIACDRASILLEERGKLVVKVIRKREGVPHHSPLAVSTTLLAEVLRERKAVFTRDTSVDPRFRPDSSVKILDIRSALTVPLLTSSEVLGVIQLHRVLQSPPFVPADLHLLGLIANHAASNLAKLRLLEDLQETNRRLRAAQQETLGWNAELEQKVEERTFQLAQKAQEIARLVEQKDELLGTVAHDLRTPLCGLVGFADMALLGLRSGRPPEQLAADLEMIKRIGEDMSELLDDLLDVTCIESGRLRLQRELAPIGAVLEETAATYARLAEINGLTLRLELEQALPAIHHDPTRLRQVVGNLVHNAVKFCRPGDAITIGARRAEHQVEVAVTDTGPGIPPEELATVFGRFEQGKVANTIGAEQRRGKGTGLGLAIACKLVELHGGRIWVESDGRSGSSFRFALPLA
ncbi:MAG: hypothetical protein KatS3mg102_0186 [Planctomycetota bacterium]|nr:MAG: hypothetical protein KatS3mg102_0186 [Planctomycetota bacterium]